MEGISVGGKNDTPETARTRRGAQKEKIIFEDNGLKNNMADVNLYIYLFLFLMLDMLL